MEHQIRIEEKPYSYRRVRGILFWNGFYEIMYDECPIRIVNTRAQAEDMITLLNAAFNEGFRLRGYYN